MTLEERAPVPDGSKVLIGQDFPSNVHTFDRPARRVLHAPTLSVLISSALPIVELRRTAKSLGSPQSVRYATLRNSQ
jgi:hypothetical protein